MGWFLKHVSDLCRIVSGIHPKVAEILNRHQAPRGARQSPGIVGNMEKVGRRRKLNLEARGGSGHYLRTSNMQQPHQANPDQTRPRPSMRGSQVALEEHRFRVRPSFPCYQRCRGVCCAPRGARWRFKISATLVWIPDTILHKSETCLRNQPNYYHPQ